MSGDPVATVLFCDDVRQEVSGKLLLVGVYQADMVISELPAVLPQLNAVITLMEPKDSPSRSVGVIIDIPGGLEFKATMQGAQPSQEEQLLLDTGEVTHYPTRGLLHLGNVQIGSEGRIVVYIETPTRRIRAGSLRVVKEPPAMVPASP